MRCPDAHHWPHVAWFGVSEFIGQVVQVRRGGQVGVRVGVFLAPSGPFVPVPGFTAGDLGEEVGEQVVVVGAEI